MFSAAFYTQMTNTQPYILNTSLPSPVIYKSELVHTSVYSTHYYTHTIPIFLNRAYTEPWLLQRGSHCENSATQKNHKWGMWFTPSQFFINIRFRHLTHKL